MANGKKQAESAETQRSDRVKLTAEESLKRLRTFSERKAAFVAAVRKSQNRSAPA